MAIRENMIVIDDIPEKDIKEIQEENLLAYALQELKKKVSTIDIATTTLPEIIKEAMQIVEKTTIKGTKQREFVIKLLRKLFKDLTDNEEEILLLKLIDNGTVSNMIDLVVDASKGKIDINKTVKISLSLLLSCAPYILTKCKKNCFNFKSSKKSLTTQDAPQSN